MRSTSASSFARLLPRLLPPLLGLLLALPLCLVAAAATPSVARAEMLELWVRGDASYFGAATELRHFEQNDKGVAFGFALGAEILQIDVFADINFDPGGSQFNQLGLGFDLDLLPGEAVSLMPAVQALYFFGRHEDASAESDRGLHARAGGIFEVELLPFVWFGLEGFAGYLFSLPEKESGMVYSGAGYVAFKVDIL